jgi:hypothetical protein
LKDILVVWYNIQILPGFEMLGQMPNSGEKCHLILSTFSSHYQRIVKKRILTHIASYLLDMINRRCPRTLVVIFIFVQNNKCDPGLQFSMVTPWLLTRLILQVV